MKTNHAIELTSGNDKPVEQSASAGAQTAEGARVILLGQDVHAATITVEVQLDGRVAQPPQKIPTEKYLAWVQQLQARHPQAKLHAVYEAGPCGYWLHRALLALGVDNRVVAPAALNGRRKCDRLDASALRRQLAAQLGGDRHAYSAVRTPSAEQERQRALVRHRGALGRSLRRAVQQGRSALLLQGLRVSGTWWGKRRWPELKDTLPEWLREMLADFQAQAQLLHGQIRALDLKLAALAKTKNIAPPRGIGALTWLILLLEVGEWSRFRNRREVASYTGLCGGHHSSGERRREGAIDKRGNPRVRHALQEAVWRLLVWQPDYPPLQRILAAKGSRARRRAAVAAARRLAIDLWRLATGQMTAAQLHLDATA